MIRNLQPIWIMFFFVFFFNIINVNHFLNCFIKLCLCSILCICFYQINWLDSLSSSELKEILSVSSVNTLCFSLLNLGCVFNISFFFFMNSFWSFLRFSMLILFFLIGLFYFQFELLLNSFYNLQCLFITHFFAFCFFILIIVVF